MFFLRLTICQRTQLAVLGLVFLEVAAFYGVYLNLVVYLQDVLHGDSASNAAAVSLWAGASYLMPVIGAAIADTYWGKYKTVLVGLSISLAVCKRFALHNLASALR
jgi:peptide/histidine transporter 3/4